MAMREHPAPEGAQRGHGAVYARNFKLTLVSEIHHPLLYILAPNGLGVESLMRDAAERNEVVNIATIVAHR